MSSLNDRQVQNKHVAAARAGCHPFEIESNAPYVESVIKTHGSFLDVDDFSHQPPASSAPGLLSPASSHVTAGSGAGAENVRRRRRRRIAFNETQRSNSP